MTKFSRLLMTSVSAMVIGISTPCLAESGTSAQDSEKVADADSPADAGEIIVTAQRKSENLQRVPIAITAISPERVEQLNLRDLTTLQQVTPGLSVSSGINYALVYVRGVGQNLVQAGLENPVATYIDGAYLERSFGGVYDIVDPASLQVLKGPQGTLWGRNSTGGALLITTADPAQGKFGGRILGELGNQGHQLVEGTLNAPLSDTVAVRFAARYHKDDGYVRNLPDNFMFGADKGWTARAKIAFEPTSDFKAVLQYQYDRGEHG